MSVKDRDRILVLRERFPWMGEFSGYDRLFHYLREDRRLTCDSIMRNRIYPPAGACCRLSICGVTPEPRSFYGPTSFLAEMMVINEYLRKPFRLVHVSYVENHLRWLARLKKICGFRVTGTVHQSPRWWDGQRERTLHDVKLLDALVCLSGEQAEYFSAMGVRNVRFIPHGIDTTFFSPEIQEQGARPDAKQGWRCLCVGGWRRDFELLEGIARRALAAYGNVSFDLLIKKVDCDAQTLRRLESIGRVRVISGSDDAGLKQLYRDSRVLIVPMKDSVANNAILEAMACGLPVIATDVGGVRDYLGDSCNDCVVPYGSPADAYVDRIGMLLGDVKGFRDRKIASRKRSERYFAWPRVSETIADLFLELLEGS